jgi:hypothetical protein
LAIFKEKAKRKKRLAIKASLDKSNSQRMNYPDCFEKQIITQVYELLFKLSLAYKTSLSAVRAWLTSATKTPFKFLIHTKYHYFVAI